MSEYPVIWQCSVGNLRAVKHWYGIDYYWRGNWLMTSAPQYVLIRLRGYNKDIRRRVFAFDLRYGALWDGQEIVRFPVWLRWLTARKTMQDFRETRRRIKDERLTTFVDIRYS